MTLEVKWKIMQISSVLELHFSKVQEVFLEMQCTALYTSTILTSVSEHVLTNDFGVIFCMLLPSVPSFPRRSGDRVPRGPLGDMCHSSLHCHKLLTDFSHVVMCWFVNWGNCKHRQTQLQFSSWIAGKPRSARALLEVYGERYNLDEDDQKLKFAFVTGGVKQVVKKYSLKERDS